MQAVDEKNRVVSVGFSIHFAESFFFKRHSMVYLLDTFSLMNFNGKLILLFSPQKPCKKPQVTTLMLDENDVKASCCASFLLAHK